MTSREAALPGAPGAATLPLPTAAPVFVMNLTATLLYPNVNATAFDAAAFDAALEAAASPFGVASVTVTDVPTVLALSVVTSTGAPLSQPQLDAIAAAVASAAGVAPSQVALAPAAAAPSGRRSLAQAGGGGGALRYNASLSGFATPAASVAAAAALASPPGEAAVAAALLAAGASLASPSASSSGASPPSPVTISFGSSSIAALLTVSVPQPNVSAAQAGLAAALLASIAPNGADFAPGVSAASAAAAASGTSGFLPSPGAAASITSQLDAVADASVASSAASSLLASASSSAASLPAPSAPGYEAAVLSVAAVMQGVGASRIARAAGGAFALPAARASALATLALLSRPPPGAGGGGGGGSTSSDAALPVGATAYGSTSPVPQAIVSALSALLASFSQPLAAADAAAAARCVALLLASVSAALFDQLLAASSSFSSFSVFTSSPFVDTAVVVARPGAPVLSSPVTAPPYPGPTGLFASGFGPLPSSSLPPSSPVALLFSRLGFDPHGFGAANGSTSATAFPAPLATHGGATTLSLRLPGGAALHVANLSSPLLLSLPPVPLSALTPPASASAAATPSHGACVFWDVAAASYSSSGCVGAPNPVPPGCSVSFPANLTIASDADLAAAWAITGCPALTAGCASAVLDCGSPAAAALQPGSQIVLDPSEPFALPAVACPFAPAPGAPASAGALLAPVASAWSAETVLPLGDAQSCV